MAGIVHFIVNIGGYALIEPVDGSAYRMLAALEQALREGSFFDGEGVDFVEKLIRIVGEVDGVVVVELQSIEGEHEAGEARKGGSGCWYFIDLGCQQIGKDFL